jgi:hypothetical protein
MLSATSEKFERHNPSLLLLSSVTLLPPPFPRCDWLRLLPQSDTLRLRLRLGKLILLTLLRRLRIPVKPITESGRSRSVNPVKPITYRSEATREFDYGAK